MLDRYQMPKMSAKAAGTSTVVRGRSRPRICSRSSRLATSRTLRIGFASHGLDKNLFERGLDQLVTKDGGYGGGFMQQLLRVAMLFEANFDVAGEAVGLGNLFAREKCGAAFEFNDNAVALVAAFDFAHLAREHCLALVNEADRVAELLNLIHAVR